MTLLELLYFGFVTLGAAFASTWAYHHGSWTGGVLAFGIVEGFFVWLFFSGSFYRLIAFILKLPDFKD